MHPEIAAFLVTAEELAHLFVRPAAAQVASPAMAGLPLLPGEGDGLRGAARRAEFAAGRACAREALSRLGAPAGPILRSSSRAPVWPSGFVGSITHCEGFCAAVIARSQELLSVGLDAEAANPLTPAVARRVCTERELAGFAALPDRPALVWAKLAFSAKEAVHKAIHPLTGVTLDFQDVSVSFAADRFSVAAMRSGEKTDSWVAAAEGRWRVDGQRVYTGVSVVAARL